MPTHGSQVNNIDGWPFQWWEFMDRANLNHQPPPGWLNGCIPMKFIYCLIYIYIYTHIASNYPSLVGSFIVIYCFYYLWVGNNQESKLVNHPTELSAGWIQYWIHEDFIRHVMWQLVQTPVKCWVNDPFTSWSSNLDFGILANGFVWKCRVNLPNEIAIFNRDNDQQNHWV